MRSLIYKVEETRRVQETASSKRKVLAFLLQLKKTGKIQGIFGRLVRTEKKYKSKPLINLKQNTLLKSINIQFKKWGPSEIWNLCNSPREIVLAISQSCTYFVYLHCAWVNEYTHILSHIVTHTHRAKDRWFHQTEDRIINNIHNVLLSNRS